jgi:hypothetical protein
METNKSQIKEITQEVRKYVNKADPWYLIESGAPADEYNSQVDRIVSTLINKKFDLESLSFELHNVFRTEEHSLDSIKIDELAKELRSINFE